MNGRTVFVCFVALAIVILLNLPLPVSMRIKSGTRDNVAPFQNVMSLILHRGRTTLAYLADTSAAAKSVQDMEVELARLQYQVERLKALKDENAELREQLGLKAPGGERLIAATVVGRGDISGWWHTVRLDRGASDGVRTNCAVVAAGGLVGRVTAVSEHTSDVLLITDPTSRVAVKLSQPGSYGILRGRGVTMTGRPAIEMLHAPEPGEVDYLSKHLTVNPGDRVLTSGLGGVYPGGLPVGRVIGTSRPPSGLYQCASIEPSADLNALRYAFVVDDRP